jgi:hypothetical protein
MSAPKVTSTRSCSNPVRTQRIALQGPRTDRLDCLVFPAEWNRESLERVSTYDPTGVRRRVRLIEPGDATGTVSLQLDAQVLTLGSALTDIDTEPLTRADVPADWTGPDRRAVDAVRVLATGRPWARADDATLTPALPKTGLLRAREGGRLFVADISVPPLLCRRMGIEVRDPFGAAPVVPLGVDGEVLGEWRTA